MPMWSTPDGMVVLASNDSSKGVTSPRKDEGDGDGSASYSPKYEGEGLTRAFSSLGRGLLPRNERRKATAGDVGPLRVAPGLDGPDEDDVDTVLACRVGKAKDALGGSSRSMKLDELVLLLRL